MSWLEKLKSGLSKTSTNIVSGINDIISKRKLDEKSAQELEDLLISADLGAENSQYLVKKLVEKFRFSKEVSSLEIKQALASLISDILEPLSSKEIEFNQKPKILILCGVNGNGKTTSVAKLSHYYKNRGKSIMIAACDTFRAAAVEQLKIWADRINIPIITAKQNIDPASVAYKAVQEAIANNIDLLLLDTAGRLHNKTQLMDELSKIIKIAKKIDEDITPEIILVLDATTGQNAIIQLEKFQEIAQIDKLVITKLDGTAKGGIIVPISQKYNIPILAIGVGESIDDLRPFSAQDFANNLCGIN